MWKERGESCQQEVRLERRAGEDHVIPDNSPFWGFPPQSWTQCWVKNPETCMFSEARSVGSNPSFFTSSQWCWKQIMFSLSSSVSLCDKCGFGTSLSLIFSPPQKFFFFFFNEHHLLRRTGLKVKSATVFLCKLLFLSECILVFEK